MTIALWSSDAWRQEAVAWLDEQLAADGTRRVGEVTQPHLRPWATVLRAPTTRGVVWLKAAGDLAAHAELVEELELACRVGKVGRALSWDRAVRLQGEEAAGEFADAPLRALESLLSDSAIVAV